MLHWMGSWNEKQPWDFYSESARISVHDPNISKDRQPKISEDVPNISKVVSNISWPQSQVVSLPQFQIVVVRFIAGFHMTSLNFKLQNYWSSRDFTFMMY